MKKTLFLALLACFTLMFASCNKEKELTGTSWKTHTVVDQDITIQGITIPLDMTVDGTMKFSDSTNNDGSMNLSYNGTVTIPILGARTISETDNTVFTYVFDGEAGTMTATVDGETSTVPFTYNKEDNTIHISVSKKYEEVGAEINFEMVFTEVK